MANHPEDYHNHSTLEAVEHHPDVFPHSNHDAKFAIPNNPGYSTLESTYWQPAYQNQNQNENLAHAAYSTSPVAPREEYSTLESTQYDPKGTSAEKGGVADGESGTEKEGWKRRRVCGVPLLFLLTGLALVLVVIGAVVGGVVATRLKMDSGQSTSDQSGTKPEGAQTTGYRASTTVNTNGKFTKPSSTSTPATPTVDESRWKPVEWPSDKYYMIGMGADSVADFYWLGHNESAPFGSDDEIIAPSDRAAQDERTVIADWQQWQFESAKDANLPDTLAVELQENLPSMAYWLHNKASPGYVLGFNLNAFSDFVNRNVSGGATKGLETFPLSLLPVNRTDSSQMWMVSKTSDSRWVDSFEERDYYSITNFATVKEGVDPSDWHLHYKGLASHSSQGDDFWWIKNTGQAAPDPETSKPIF